MLLPCACKLNENFQFQWIHLNFGDEGLKRVFRRIYAQLRPGLSNLNNSQLLWISISWFSGGTFILESQAFCTYRKKKKLTEKIFHNFKVISCDVTNIIDETFSLQNIKLKPENFTDFLIHEVRNVLPAQLFLFTINCFLQVGFSRSEVLALPAHPAKGFQRPLQVILSPQRNICFYDSRPGFHEDASLQQHLCLNHPLLLWHLSPLLQSLIHSLLWKGIGSHCSSLRSV